VDGLDLASPLSQQDVANLGRALAEHQVIVFRDQHITPENHRDLGHYLGPLMIHGAYPAVEGYPEVMVLENDRHNPSKIDEWHSDMSFTETPPRASILIARIMPSRGGDTLFASMSVAYDDLSEKVKASLEGLTATHSLAHGFRDSLAEPGGREKLQTALDANPEVVHPVVRTHPETGRKLIFVNRTFTSRINELTQGQSKEMLDMLCDHAVQEKYRFRVGWQPDTIVIWDNRAVQHVPVNDYWPASRRMERVTIGDALRPT